VREPYVGSSEREYVLAIQQLVRGRSNAVGQVTLTANAASTTVTLDERIANENGHPVFTASTANAAAEQAAGTMYVSSVTKTGFVITHANNAQTDRTFYYEFRGG
jgi:N-acetylmuramoyl-L-alanine amidase